ncbi:MAG TPA: PKD domain-containing protein, partial [Thermoplasmata archaeon]|nr:PKD domain-containing protein [Thermoplasmata archaeon]
DYVYFRINVTNTGNVPLTNLTVNDTLPDFLTHEDSQYIEWTISSLDVDSYYIINFNATPLAGGEGNNVATVETDQEVNASDIAHVKLTAPYIDVEKKVRLICGEGLWKDIIVTPPGDVIEFQISICYMGDPHYAFHNITIVDTLPTGFTYITGSANFSGDYFSGSHHIEPTIADNVLTWHLNDSEGWMGILDGHCLYLIFKVKVSNDVECGEHTNYVEVTGQECSGTTLDGSDYAEIYVPCIEVEKKVWTGEGWGEHTTIDVGETVHFKITVCYIGSGLYHLHKLVFNDTLPAVFEYEVGSAYFTGTYFSGREYLEPVVDGNNLIWAFNDTENWMKIPDGECLYLFFNATAIKCAEEDLENLIIVTGEECSGTQMTGSDNAYVEVPCEPEIEVEKKVKHLVTGEWVETVYVYPATILRFNITVTNPGVVTLDTIKIHDVIPVQLKYMGNATPVEPVQEEQHLNWTLGPLDGGESLYIEFDAKVKFYCENCYRNWVYVTGSRCGYNDVEDNDSAEFCVRLDPNKPVSSVDPILPYWRNTTPIIITANATDDVEVAKVTLFYRYSSDNITWNNWTAYGDDLMEPWSWSFDPMEGDGYYEFYSIATDDVGNVEDASSGYDAMAGFDTIPPESYVEPITPYIQESTPIMLSVNASDALSGVKNVFIYYRYSPDNITWSDWALTNENFMAPEGDGYYQFHTVAEDVAGNIENPPSLPDYDAECKLETPEPLEAIIYDVTWEGIGQVGDIFYFDGDATGGVPPYTFSWDFGDEEGATGEDVTHVYSAPGTYTVTLTVEDNVGHVDDATTSVQVHPLTPLKVNITRPEQGGFYFRDIRMFSIPFLNMTIIIGPITIDAEVSNAVGAAEVEFYIEGALKSTDSLAPYSYLWSERAFGRYTIEVVACDSLTRTATDSISVFVISLGIGAEKPGILKGKVYDNSTLLKKGIPDATITVIGEGINTTTGKFPWNKGRYSLTL